MRFASKSLVESCLKRFARCGRFTFPMHVNEIFVARFLKKRDWTARQRRPAPRTEPVP